MFKDKKMAIRLQKAPLGFLFTFILLILLAPACFSQEKITPTGTDTQAQQTTIDQQVAELEA